MRRRLRQWYARYRRDLPWRRTRNPYAIWLSEIMLQQTRVQAVIPYYERFLERFPTAAALAAAAETDVLALWSGLGYYSRARNLHRAARRIAQAGEFPAAYDAIRALPGIGDYTAAAVASIAFGLPYAAVDGNVLRVLARLHNDAGDISAPVTRTRLREAAARLLDTRHPGEFNQAMMELGATICLPRSPQCPECPLAADCEAHRQGTAAQLPVKLRKVEPVKIRAAVVIVERGESILLWQREAQSQRMAGFWELPSPDQLPGLTRIRTHGVFRHTITHHHFEIEVQTGNLRAVPPECRWFARADLASIPLSTTARKALRQLGR